MLRASGYSNEAPKNRESHGFRRRVLLHKFRLFFLSMNADAIASVSNVLNWLSRVVNLWANAAYFLHCYVQNSWCFGHGRSVSNGFAEQSGSAESISLSKVAQQSSFQSLAIFFVSATELRSEKTKVFKKDENVEEDQKQKMNERDKRRDERWKMK